MNARYNFSIILRRALKVATAPMAILLVASPALVRAQITGPAYDGSQAPGPIPSQSTPPAAAVPNQISLDAAIKAALDRNYTVRTASNTSRKADVELRRSDANLLPTAAATASYGYSYSLASAGARTVTFTDPGTGFPTTTATKDAGSHTLSYGASVDFNIYNGGGDAARIRGANQSLENAQWSLTSTRQLIAFNVTSNYINALRSNELVDAAQKTLQEALAQRSLIKGKYDVGVIPIGQVYQQDAVVGQDSLALIDAINTYENAKADLLFLLNVPPNQYSSYGLSLAGIDTSTSAASRASVDTSITDVRLNAAIDNRPDVIAQRHAIQASIEAIDQTRAGLLPKLNATAGIGGNGANSDLTKVSLDHHLSAGLSLNVPLFDGMQNRLLIEEEEIGVESDRIALEQLVQQIRSDAAKALNNLHSSDEAIGVSEIALTSAEESLRLAEERLQVGAGTQVDVVIAEAAVETARTNRVNAKFNYILAQHQLAYTLGQTKY